MRLATRVALVAMSAVIAPQVAYAQTLGDLLSNMAGEIYRPFFFLIACSSFIGGLVLLAVGLLKLSRQNDTRGGLWDSGLAHIVAAALLIALPDAAGTGVMTVFGNVTGAGTLQGNGLDVGNDGIAGSASSADIASGVFAAFANVGTVENCLAAAAPAACMAKNIAVNAIPMATWMLFGMSFLAGLVIFASAIMDITKTQQNHGMPRGWLAKVVTSVLLLNSATLFTFASKTVLGRNDGPINEQGLNAGSSMLTYAPQGASIDIVKKYAELIGWCFTILAFFGAWAFVRGIFIIKASGEGRSQDGIGKGLVFIIAGILLANAKYTACVVLTTMGGSDMGNGFCQ